MITDPTTIVAIAGAIGAFVGTPIGYWAGRRPNAERERALRQIADDAKEESEARHRSIIHLASMRDAALAELAERTRTIRYLRNQIEEMGDEVRHYERERTRLCDVVAKFEAKRERHNAQRKALHEREKAKGRGASLTVSNAMSAYVNGSGAPLEART
jgi:hypothetical protein